MNNPPHAAPETEKEEAFWEHFCIACEPTGAGLLAADDPETAPLGWLNFAWVRDPSVSTERTN